MPKRIINDFSKLEFAKSDLNFKDNRIELDGMLKGTFTRDGLREKLQKFSDELKGKKGAMLGCAFHFKEANDWVPAVFTSAGEPVSIWEPLDSPKGAMYEGNSIDGCVFYIVKHPDAKEDTKIFRKPQSQNKVVTKDSYFGKK
jgi:hypothetical protein